jgi:hypothetical protein
MLHEAFSRPSTAAALRSWALPVPEGAYARIPCWNGSDCWFDALMDALATPEGEALRKRWKVKATTLLAIANEYRQHADHDTGRGVTVCHERIREAIGRKSNKTIQRATRLLEALGFAATVVEGRYLTVAERQAAFEFHGGRQIKAGSIVALTLPPVDKSCTVTTNVHLPEGSPAINSPHPEIDHQSRASAKKEAAPRPQPEQRSRSRRRQGPPAGQPRELTRHLFLAQLDQAYGNLLAGRIDSPLDDIRGGRHHIGQLDKLLRRSGIDITAWTVPELVAALDEKIPDGRVRMATARDPLRYFAWMVRTGLDAGALPLRVVRERQAQRRAEERAELAREREETRRRLSADDPAETARILAQLHADTEASRLAALRSGTHRKFRRAR